MLTYKYEEIEFTSHVVRGCLALSENMHGLNGMPSRESPIV